MHVFSFVCFSKILKLSFQHQQKRNTILIDIVQIHSMQQKFSTKISDNCCIKSISWLPQVIPVYMMISIQTDLEEHDDVIKWKHFPRYWPFVRIIGEFPAQRPITRSFDVYFDLRPNKQLSKQPWCWWFETPSRSLWLHRNVFCFDRSNPWQTSLNFWVQSEVWIPIPNSSVEESKQKYMLIYATFYAIIYFSRISVLTHV